MSVGLTPTGNFAAALTGLTIASLVAGLSALSTTSAESATLEDVRTRGHLICGVSLDTPGFSSQDADGRWTGLDVDTCRAVAAATLGDAEKVAYSGLSAKERFTALQAGDVDMLALITTWTLLRDAALEVNFAGVTFYDGQGFMVRKDLGLDTAKALDGAMVCTTTGTTSERNLVDFFRINNMTLRTLQFESSTDGAIAHEQGKCDAVTNDRSSLAAYRTKFEIPGAHVILPDVLSKEPLGPVVRHGDDQWFDIVKWAVFALIQAEESGVTSQNVDDMKASEDPTIQRLLGVAGDMGRQMGLSDDWAYQIVKQVGNYGEIYKRNVGPNTPLGLERGPNALWTDGGLMYAMPFR
jgi:general L-amino acid transport system substrate-binding protein